MDIFTLAAKLKLDSKDFVKEIDKSEGLFANFGNKLKSGIGAIAKIGAASIGAATAALVPFFKSATEAYANYEQLVGGVDTLFKDSSKKVQEYAQKAWSTAGMSANEYMETVTSFSASLLQGLKGDTSKAADVADMAIRDMSDNANKMGTDISAIQNAYQGFAKQNYTMLDNLKLGYGGTKTEMERLLKDAQKLTGKKYNLNNLADVYEAIHAIQQEMGITGTTSKEASTTIEGSVKSLKAAWQDALVAITSGDKPIRASAKVLSHAFKTVLSNLVPTIKRALSGFGEFIQYVGPMIGKELPGLIAELVPGFISAGWDMITGIGKGLIEGVKAIKWPTWDEIKAGAIKLWDDAKAAVAAFGGLVFGKNEKGEVKWPKLEDLKDFAKNKIWEPLKLFVSNVFNLGGKLIFGTDKTNGEVNWPKLEDLQNAAKDLWGKLKTFVANAFNLGGKLIFGEKTNGEVNYPTWGKIGAAINTAWGKIVEEAGKLTGFVLGNIGDASTVIASIEEKWKNLKETVTTNAIDFISGLTGTDSETAGKILNTLVTSIEAIGASIMGYSLATTLPTVINAIVGLFSSGITAVNPVGIAIGTIAAAGVLIYKNWDGIQKFFEDLWSAVSTAVSTAWDNVQNWWTKDILGPVQQKWNEVSSFITGIWGGITGAIQTAIDKINEFFGLHDDGFTTESGQHFTGSSYDMQSQGQSGPQRNRTVTGTASEDQMRGHATGAWNIPYDNYRAVLHRNEMVLNATQARQYREGKGNSAGIDLDAMVNRIVAAVTTGIENANIDLDGEKITRNVNRRLAANVRAKRFA